MVLRGGEPFDGRNGKEGELGGGRILLFGAVGGIGNG
jgi:hypothetical protein